MSTQAGTAGLPLLGEATKVAFAMPNGILFGLGYGIAIRVGYEILYPLLFPKGDSTTSDSTGLTLSQSSILSTLTELYSIFGGLGAHNAGIESGIKKAMTDIEQATGINFEQLRNLIAPAPTTYVPPPEPTTTGTNDPSIPPSYTNPPATNITPTETDLSFTPTVPTSEQEVHQAWLFERNDALKFFIEAKTYILTWPSFRTDTGTNYTTWWTKYQSMKNQASRVRQLSNDYTSSNDAIRRDALTLRQQIANGLIDYPRFYK